MSEESEKRHTVTVGRYLLHRQIARGGMATIHIARLMGDEGFSRIVAAKRLLPEFAEDTEFVAMFMDEARIASKVHHPNVVPVLDLVTTTDEVMLVQEYVHGVPLHWLLRTAHEAKTHVPINVAVSIACQTLAGLHAAHETVDEMGAPLNIVHRDVSPQNVMVAVDGTGRLLDFGVAKASMAAHITREGVFKGKLAYSAPEQIKGHAVRQSDVYAASVVLWELLVGHRMHGGAQAEAELVGEIMSGSLPTITDALAQEKEWLGANRWKQLEQLEPIIKKGLSTNAEDRWLTAADMEAALATAVPPASPTGVAAWLKALGKSFLEGRDKVIAEEEASWRRTSSSVPRRLTPVPGELKAVRLASEPGVDIRVETTPGVTPDAPRPPAPTTRSSARSSPRSARSSCCCRSRSSCSSSTTRRRPRRRPSRSRKRRRTSRRRRKPPRRRRRLLPRRRPLRPSRHRASRSRRRRPLRSPRRSRLRPSPRMHRRS